MIEPNNEMNHIIEKNFNINGFDDKNIIIENFGLSNKDTKNVPFQKYESVHSTIDWNYV